MTKTKLGVVLSGGGAKGAYEVGFLKALAEFDIQPEAISGTSIGALNGAIYSAQKDTKISAKLLVELWNDLANSDVLEVDKEKAVKTIIDVLMHFAPVGNVTKLGKLLMIGAKGAKSQEGILTQAPLINRLEQHAPSQALKKGLPFHIGLTKAKGHAIDLKNFLGFGNEETVYKKIQDLNENEMHKAIMASASLPILFDSLEVQGEKYSDGCLSSTDNEWGNTPVKPLVEKEGCTHIIVCHLNEGSFFDRHDELFKDISIIEVRPKAGTFNSALDPLQFKIEKIGIWMDQGYKDSKRILGDAFKALEVVENRKVAERSSDNTVDRLKNRNFKLG
ncbi:Patatin [hydrothermal vent metagenome]|uniref:Patatin n=1 Tax=hydrothermal vent metagenome TaxID=652676 RepID=A0A1W1BQC4_9ZZZZ